MSTLEHIRQRPLIIVSVLGFSILLFVLTAVSSPEKLFSDHSTVLKVNGQKIPYDQFSQRSELVRKQFESNNYRNVDNAVIQEQAMQSLISETLLDQEMDRLGITVTGEELGQAMLGDNLPMAVQYIYWQRQQQGLYSGRDLHELAFNPQAYQLDAETAAQFKAEWMDLEKTVVDALKKQKLQNLLAGTLAANNLDAKSLYDDNNNSTDIRYVKVDVSTVPDADVEISDADLKARYEQDKELYRLDNDTYVLNYIVAEVTPSDEDRLEATRAVEDALLKLREMPAGEALAGNNKFVVNHYNTAAKYLPANISGKLESLAQDSVQQLSFYDNKYTLVKFEGTDMVTDSITCDMIALVETANVDSIIDALNNGATLDNLAEGTVLQSQLGQRLSMLNNPQASLYFGQAAEGEYFNKTDITGQPNVLFRLAKKDAPVEAYKISEVTYQLEPSTATVNDTQSRLRAYVANNNTAAAFKDNAIAANFTCLPANVTNASFSVAGVPDTRSLVKWASEAKKGQVSDVYANDDKSMFFAAALADKYDKGYVPMSDAQVAAQTRAKVLRSKKAEKLLADFQGKGNSVDSYASAMKAKVDTTNVTFGKNSITGFMPGDGKAIAIATATPVGQVSGPEATDYSVVVLETIGQNGPAREYDAVNAAAYFDQTQGAQVLMNSLADILRANAKIDNKSLKFFVINQ